MTDQHADHPESETVGRGRTTAQGREPHRQGNDNSAEGVRKWLEQQGYALEHLTAAAFSEAGYVVRQGLAYRDGSEGKVREVDVEARAQLHFDAVELHIVVECKRSDSPWVVRTTRLPLQKGNMRWQPIASPKVIAHLDANRQLLRNAFRLGSPTAFDVIQAHREPGPGSNPAYSALSQVVSSASGLLASEILFPNPALLHPVIVLDAPLFLASFGTYPSTDVEPIEQARIHWSGSQAAVSPVVVDVVTVGALDAYASAIRDDLEDLARELGKTGTDFRTETPGPRIY